MKRTFITLFMAISVMSGFSQNSEYSEYAGWYKIHNDSIHGANINAAIDYIKANKIKYKKNIIVGVLDSGIDTSAVALKQVLWTNKKEKADGKDNDKNGYVDDLHGWNFLGTADGSFNMLRAGTEEYREFKRLYPKYKNVKDGDAETNMWPLEYAYYKKVRKKCGVGSYMMFYQFSQQKAVTIAKMDSLLHTVKNLNPDTLTIAGLFTQEVEDSAWAQYGQEIYVDLIKAEPTQTWPEFKKTQAEALKQMAHNLWKIEGEADKRLLIGDDMNNAADRYYGNGKLDIEGYEHGTFVASVIAGKADKEHDAFSGIWSNARIMAVRCSPDGDEYDKDVASSIHYAVDNGAKVINISLAKYLSPDHKMVDDALLYAQKHDVLVIAAAGNNRTTIITMKCLSVWFCDGQPAIKNPFFNFNPSVLPKKARKVYPKKKCVPPNTAGSTTIRVPDCECLEHELDETQSSSIAPYDDANESSEVVAHDKSDSSFSLLSNDDEKEADAMEVQQGCAEPHNHSISDEDSPYRDQEK